MSTPSSASFLPTDDRELFLRLKQDPATVGEVYDRYANRLYAFLLKRCGHKETAEDLVAHTFMKFLEALPMLEWRGTPLHGFLYRIASNALIDHWRKRSTSELPFDPEENDVAGFDDPAGSAEISLGGDQLREVMQHLSPRDQEVLSLRFYAGLEAREIAEVLETTPNHAAVLVYRALARLRQKFIKRYPSTV